MVLSWLVPAEPAEIRTISGQLKVYTIKAIIPHILICLQLRVCRGTVYPEPSRVSYLPALLRTLDLSAIVPGYVFFPPWDAGCLHLPLGVAITFLALYSIY